MSFNRETKAFGSIRRYKGYGACGVILGLAALSIATSHTSVSADEVKPSDSKVEVTGEVKESAIKNETPTGNAATSSIQAVPTRPEEHKTEIAKEGSVTGDASVTVDHTDVTKAAEAAKEVGVNVVQDKTKVAPTTSTAEDTAKAVKSISAEEKQQASTINSTATVHSTAVSNWVEEKKSTVAYNEELTEAHKHATDSYKEFISTLDDNVAKVVAQYKDAIIEVSEKLQDSSDGKTVEGYHAYIRSLAEQQGLNKDAIKTYLVKKADYNEKSAKYSETVLINASNSARIDSENTAKSQSVVAENTRLSNSAKEVENDNAAKSNSVRDENNRRSTSAKTENERLSNSAKNVENTNNVAKSTSAAKENERRSNSARIENERRSNAVKHVEDNNRTKSLSVVAENNKRSLAADKETARRSQSAVVENARRSNSAKAENERRTQASTSIKNAITRVDKDADAKIKSLRDLGAHVVVRTEDVSTEAAAKAIEERNKKAYNDVKAAQEEWKRKYEELKAKSKTEGYAKDVVLQSLNLNKANPNATVKSTKSGSWVKASYIASPSGSSGYARVLNSEWAYKFADVRTGWSTDIDYTNLSGLSVTTEDGKTHPITRIHRNFAVKDEGSSGPVDVYAVEDPTEGFVVARSEGTGSSSDKIRFNVTDSYYYTVDGKEVKFTASNKSPISLTYSSLNYNNVGWEGASAIGGRHVEINGSTVTYHPDYGYVYASSQNRDIGYDWDVSGSKYEYKGAALGVFEKGSEFTTEFIQWDGPVSGGNTYWFTINTRAVAPVINIPKYATITKVRFSEKPGTPVTYTPVTFEKAKYTPVTYTPDPKPKYEPVTYEKVTYTPEKVDWKPVSYKEVTFTPKNIDWKPVTYTPTPYVPEKLVEVPKEPVLKLAKVVAPIEPVFKEIPKEPKAPEVHYHLTALNENTPVEKEVRNEENVSINGESVAKNSTNYFVLKPSALPANRPVTKSIGFSDYIAGGLDLDIKGMQKVNPNYTVAFESSTRLLTVSAKENEIAKSNENLKDAYNVTPFTVIFKPVNDAAVYENVFKFDINGGAKGEDPNGYTSYSNKVRIHTPGSPNNPNNPNNPNGGGNHKIQPTKNNTNKEGKNINGKELLQSDVNYYVAEWDLDQYIKDKSSKSAIAKGFAYIDNYQENAVTPIVKEYYAVTSKGEKVEGLDFYEADSTKLSELPEKVQALIKDSGIDVSKFGKFQIWVAKDSQAFYDKYVKTGTDIFFHMPMSVNIGFNGKYENQTYQIDFGNGYYGNVVKNNIPNLTPKKDVVVDSTSVDNQTINYGQEFDYLLKGAKLPSNRGSHLWEVRFLDDYDEKGDKYLGYQAIASTNITVTTLEEVKADTKATEEVTLEDGTVIKVGEVIRKGSKVRRTRTYKVGDDLTKFTDSVLDEKNGVITVSFKEEFLKTVEDSSEFGADVKLHMKRIAYGEFENTYVNRINGVDYVSNTVKTNTHKPPTPEEPKKPQLPNTGETETAAASIAGYGLLALASLSLLGTTKRKDSED